MQRENWSSKGAYILTVAGATIGFGSTWRFPYLVGEYGGGAFLLLFVIIMFGLGIPLLIVESIIGRRFQKNTIDAYELKGDTPKKNKYKFIGYLAIIGAFGILAYYMVLGGWVINYIVGVASGQLSLSQGVIDRSVSAAFFQESIQNGFSIVTYTLIFAIINGLILIRGIIAGIEKAMQLLMPGLFILLVIIIARSLTLDGAMEGVKFYLTPDLSKINSEAILAALGQVFFALSIGFGVIITLSSYLGKHHNIVENCVLTGIVNTMIAFLAGFMIFPAIFAFGLSPASGPSLVFEVLPIVFSSMFLGHVFAVLFFSLLIIAALTSSISIYEVLITAISEKTKLCRSKATILTIALIFVLGNIPSALSAGILSDVTIFGKSIFDFFDFASANIFFIFTALCSALFVGFVIKDEAIQEVTNNGTIPFKLLGVWLFSIKYIIPVIILIVFLYNI